jgi:hypothetical protein
MPYTGPENGFYLVRLFKILTYLYSKLKMTIIEGIRKYRIDNR